MPATVCDAHITKKTIQQKFPDHQIINLIFGTSYAESVLIQT